MAELKFLRGSYTNWSGFTKDVNSFYIVEEQDGRFSLYLGEKFLCDGVSKADLAAAVKALEDADSALDERVASLEALMGGEGIGSVADQIKAAIEALDAEVTSTDGTHVTVKVTEVDGVVTAVNVTESDIASASETTAAINAEASARTAAIDAEASARTAADEALDARLDVIEGEAKGSIKKAVADAKAAIEGELAETDAKTLAALNDRIDTVVADGKTYSIAKVEGDELSALGANVKEAFKLVDEDGTKTGEYIQVYKDSALQSVVLEEQELVFTYLLASGETSVVKVDVSKFLAESEFANGLEVVDHVVSVKVDAASESFLTVGSDGVKLSGVQSAIDTAVSAETAAREAAITALTQTVADNKAAAEQAVADEQARAISAETANANAIAKEVEDRAAAVSAETAAREAAISALTQTVADNKAAAEQAVADEQARAISAETANANAIAKEVEDRAAAVSALTKAASDETERVNNALSDEATAREEADKAITDRLDALEDNTITGSTNVVASTDENGDTTISLQWGTF